MPLQDLYPVIDDRRYADLVAEARTRIPRYTPEWNDLNDNEPGMAVVQLLAWMSDLLLHRLAQVPKLNYLKFLDLVGVELTPARPARVELTFPVLPTFTEATVVVPLHTQVAAEIPGAPTPVVFETEASLVALSAALDAVQTDSGFVIADVSAANADAQTGIQPFGSAARPGAALMLGFDSTLDFPAGSLDLMVWIKTPRTREPLHIQSGVAQAPPATLAWEYWNGKDWYPLDLLRDETLAFSRSGHVVVSAPSKSAVGGPLLRGAIGPFALPRYWIRARLASGAYQLPPALLAVRANTVPALQAQTVDAEVLGRATGLDDQVFRLGNRPVLPDTLQLVVDEGEGELAWTEVPDFFASGPDDRHYVLNRSTGEVRFGRGSRLRVPIANPNRPANVIARSYRFGGGRAGNVDAGRVSALRGGVGGIDSAAVRNLFPAYGGGDEETLAAARERVPSTLKSHERAVTAEDFELHAKAAGGVARAKALALFHPDFPDVEVPGVVSVIVVPVTANIDPLDDPAPVPTEATLRNVCAYLDARRLATTELYALAPRYLPIVVRATLVVKPDNDLAAVKQDALLGLRRYFHPLIGGEDEAPETDGSGWPFGGGVFYSSIVQRLVVAGAKRVANLTLELDGVKHPPCEDALLPAHALLRSGAHELVVQYEELT